MDENKPDTPDAPPSVEDQAREMGWKPSEEYQGDPTKWVSAEIFVARAPLFEKIELESRGRKVLQKEVGELKQVLKDFSEHHKKVAENEYKRALSDLKRAKRSALEEGDALLAEDIQERMDNLEEPKLPEVKTAQPVDVEAQAKLDAWLAENTWYTTNKKMAAIADGIGRVSAQEGKSAEEVMKTMSKEIRELFPDAFRNKNKENAPALSGSSAAPTGNRGASYHPSEMQQKIARRMVEQLPSVYKKVEDYYKELRDLGDL